MRLKVRILDSNGNERKEMVIDVPPDITTEGLIETLRDKRPKLFDAKDYTANVELPSNKPLSGRLLDDDALVTIKPRGWDIKIIDE